MNDHDLDELLDCWTAPSPPPLLRDRLRDEFRARQPQSRHRRWLAITLLAAAVLFALIGSAVSQTPSPIPAPWTADSEFIRFAPNGSSVLEMTAASYSLNGNEIVWSRSAPRNPMSTALFRAADAALPALGRAMLRVSSGQTVPRPDNSRVFGYVTSCGGGALTRCLQIEHYFFLRKPNTCIDGSVVGHQTILNHATIGVVARMGGSLRETFWLAPDLGCFALKIDTENRLPDGSFHLVEEKRVVRISATTHQ
jgi:hypothetical protein